ncbi:MAG TPA: sigma-54 dependent transcriptional regulator [Polyangia bacterium]|nr:sigma-54 dependent transcriptional regulator [Polyangia bacterium]
MSASTSARPSAGPSSGANASAGGQGVGILVVDDEPNIRTTLRGFLENRGYLVRTAGKPDEALRALDEGVIQIVLQDLRMPDCDGVELGQRILARAPGVVVIILTAYSTIESAVRAMRAGIYDYLTKPVEPEELLAKLSRVVERMRLDRQVRDLKAQLGEPAQGLIGRSPALRRVRELVAAAARSDVPVLVSGETGTGKELVARAIHEQAPTAQGPFVALNCTAIPDALIESELFGHVRGAFTGANRARPGRIAAAAGGTLFLDEIGAAPPALQAKLLRVLQERVYTPVGADHDERAQVRVMAAMNQEPREAVQAGRLREDLFYRIGMFRIDLPPLRERLEDLPLLTDGLLARAARSRGRPPPRVAPELLTTFYAYSWPGNVRELENLLLTMLALQPGELLTAAGLPPDYAHLGTAASAAAASEEPRALAVAVENFERHFVTEALRRNGGRMRETAAELGIDERSLRRKLRRLGIDRQQVRGSDEPRSRNQE